VPVSNVYSEDQVLHWVGPKSLELDCVMASLFLIESYSIFTISNSVEMHLGSGKVEYWHLNEQRINNRIIIHD